MIERTLRWISTFLIIVSPIFYGGCGNGEPVDRETQSASKPPGPRPNVVLIVMDTVRADLLSCYGYEPDTSPNLRALRDEGVLFTRAHSTSSWTTPGHGSLFTGLYSIAHGATQERWRLEKDNVTLAEVLADQGYETIGIVENAMLSGKQGFSQGFNQYREIWRIKGKPKSPNHSLDVFREFVENYDGDSPYFIFVNLIAPHSPYNSSRGFMKRFITDASIKITDNQWRRYYSGKLKFTRPQLRHLRELYQAELLFTDHVVGLLRETLEKVGDWNNTLFIVTSDHGENFGEHGHVDHVFNLYEQTTRIPLLIHNGKEFGGGRVDERPVQLVDIFPTVLSLVGVDTADYPVHGLDLASNAIGANRPSYLEYYYPHQVFRALRKQTAEDDPRLAPYRRLLRAVIRDDVKLIWGSDGNHELYDLAADPGETRDLMTSPDFRVQRETLTELLETFVEGHGTTTYSGAPVLLDVADEETQEALRSLGYLE